MESVIVKKKSKNKRKKFCDKALPVLRVLFRSFASFLVPFCLLKKKNKKKNKSKQTKKVV